MSDAMWAVVSGAGLLLLGAMVRGLVMWSRTLGDLRRFVIPHFVPPTPDEIRLGAEDNTLPARVERQEDRLAMHLKHEEEESRKVWDQLKRINPKQQVFEGP